MEARGVVQGISSSGREARSIILAKMLAWCVCKLLALPVLFLYVHLNRLEIGGVSHSCV